jgi:hypothetical protein
MFEFSILSEKKQQGGRGMLFARSFAMRGFHWFGERVRVSFKPNRGFLGCV